VTGVSEAGAAGAAPFRALPRLARVALVVIGALPWWIPVARAELPLGGIGRALDALFVPMCHRLPDRSLALFGVLMPVCSRCAGVFAGLAAGAAVARPRLPVRVWRPILIVTAALAAADVAAQDLGLHPVWHPVRLATGFLLGYAMAASFVTALIAERR
jgi:uncharacterized membrane protein